MAREIRDRVRLVSMDPGLATFGVAALAGDGRLLGAGALATVVGDGRPEKGQGNRTSWDITDRTRRIQEVFDFCDDFCDEIEPTAIVAEAGRAMGPDVGINATIYLATGQAIVSVMARRLRIPVVWGTQLEWRRTIITNPVSGRRGTYSQAEITAAVGEDVDKTIAGILRFQGKSITLRRHAVDAVGLGRWALKYSALIRRLVAGKADL